MGGADIYIHEIFLYIIEVRILIANFRVKANAGLLVDYNIFDQELEDTYSS
jgi:hypothetical protein